MITSNPKRFAQWFNGKYIGSHRQITAEDVRDMAVCGLIHRHGYYSGINRRGDHQGRPPV